MDRFVKPIQNFNKTLCVPGDKSITHRAVMFNAVAEGEAVIQGGLLGEDCLSTINCMRLLGAEIDVGEVIRVRGTAKLQDNTVLDCGNSGTTMRLLAGLLAGAGIHAVLTGDQSLSARPMARVTQPLRQMGADITDNKGFAPIKISPSKLHGIDFVNSSGSAQVKSAVLLAGLFAEGQTVVREEVLSRSHTEEMLLSAGADIQSQGGVTVVRKSRLHAFDCCVAGDISSAAFLWALGAILPDSGGKVQNVGLSPTRNGILRVLQSMGAEVVVQNQERGRGTVTVRSKPLRGVEIGGDIIPSLIDELPVIAVLACFAKGRTVVSGARELRIKETDRIQAMADNLTAMGGQIQATEDGWVIEGRGLKGGVADSFGDHRIAMAMAVAGMCSKEGVYIKNADCVNISYPDFWEVTK